MTDYPTTNIPASLQDKIAAYLQESSRKVDNICRRNKISKDSADAMVQDMADLMQAKYTGLHATQEHIAEITTNTTRHTWNKTENPLLCMVACFYFDITDFNAGQQRLGGVEWAHPVQACECARIKGEQPTQDMITNAQRNMYLYCILIAGERCNATEEELWQVVPYDSTTPIKEQTQQRIITSAVEWGKQHKEIEATKARKKQERQARKEATLFGEDMPLFSANALAPQRTRKLPQHINETDSAAIYQNYAYMLSKEVYCTDITDNDAAAPQPLYKAIESKRQQAEQLKTDRRYHATPQQIERAESLVITPHAFTTTMTGINILPQFILAESGDTMQSTYRTTPRQFTIWATGQDSPTQSQVDDCMRALDFLSTQRLEIQEDIIKRVPAYDDKGNPIKDVKGRQVKTNKIVKTFTRFNPCTTTFYGDFNEKAQALQAKEIVLHISNIILQGRSGQHKQIVEDGKQQTYAIATPQVHRVPLWQVYEFTSDEGQRFQYAMLSKGKRNEEDLLKEVFDYDRKQAAADAAVEDAKKRLQMLATSTTATEDEMQDAQREYLKAKERATDCITKHKGRDKERLQAMFQKAQDIGLLKYWYKEQQANKTGKKITYNYVWGRFTDEEIKKHRKKKGI